jgi:hypothetical protein
LIRKSARTTITSRVDQNKVLLLLNHLLAAYLPSGQANFDKIITNKTKVSIAHRFNIIKIMNEIYLKRTNKMNSAIKDFRQINKGNPLIIRKLLKFYYLRTLNSLDS